MTEQRMVWAGRRIAMALAPAAAALFGAVTSWALHPPAASVTVPNAAAKGAVVENALPEVASPRRTDVAAAREVAALRSELSKLRGQLSAVQRESIALAHSTTQQGASGHVGGPASIQHPTAAAPMPPPQIRQQPAPQPPAPVVQSVPAAPAPAVQAMTGASAVKP